MNPISRSTDPPFFPSSFRRLVRGLESWLLLPFFPLGHWMDLGVRRFDDPQRESEGLTLVLTGIQGASFLEQLMALGLSDAGFPGRIAVIDWTTGRVWRFASHMRNTALQNAAARRIAARMIAFRAAYPDAPLHLIGYSGGAAVALQVLDELPSGHDAIVNRVTLIAAACSPEMPMVLRVARTREGIWHFRSRWDRLFLGLLTRIIGTTDGKHCVAAGCVGFSRPPHVEADPIHGAEIEPCFQERAFRWGWLRQFHYGGHLGYASRVWACETLGRTLVGRIE